MSHSSEFFFLFFEKWNCEVIKKSSQDILVSFCRSLPDQKKALLFQLAQASLYWELQYRHFSQLVGCIFLKYPLPSSIFALEMSICLKCLRRPAQVNVLYASEFSDIWGMLRTPSILNSGWGTKFSIKSPAKKKNLNSVLKFHVISAGSYTTTIGWLGGGPNVFSPPRLKLLKFQNVNTISETICMNAWLMLMLNQLMLGFGTYFSMNEKKKHTLPKGNNNYSWIKNLEMWMKYLAKPQENKVSIRDNTLLLSFRVHQMPP